MGELSRSTSASKSVSDPEDILGQFFFAFGQGAGTMRVRRGAIAALRQRYQDPIRAAGGDWDTAAPHVLSLLAQVGRLASLLATQAGRSAIGETDFTQARRMVEAMAHSRAEHAGRLIAGPFCPPVPGEEAQPEACASVVPASSGSLEAPPGAWPPAGTLAEVRTH
jgi:histone H3/H4